MPGKLYTRAMNDQRHHLPLSWLVAQRHLDLRVACGAVTDSTGFTVIQPTELPDPREFLRPDAVVLTVGLALFRDPDPFPAYLDRLAEAQVAAVGLGTGLFYPGIPDDLVQAASQRGITVLEVPRHTAFISILNAVQGERARRERLDQEHLVAVQEQLSASSVRGGLPALVTDTAVHLGAAVAVTDNDGRLQGHCDHTTATGRVLSAVEAGRHRSHSSADQRDGLWRITQRMTPQGDRVHSVTVLADHPFSPHDRAVLKHAAGLADILLQRPTYLRRAHTELNSLALRLHLGLDSTDGDGVPTSHILDSAADGDGQVRPAVVAADRPGDLRRAWNDADHATAGSGRHLFATELDPLTAVFLFRGSRSVTEIAGTFGPSAARVRIAVAEPATWDKVNLERIRRLETSARSLATGKVAGPFEAGADWLGDDAVRSALDRRAGETVDRLQQGGPDLARTLEVWLRSGGRTAATAEALGVHRHTVRTRLARIAEICEVDLSDPVVRAELLLVSVTRQ